MSVDIFGRVLDYYSVQKEFRQGPPGLEFDLTSDGHFNINNKKLTNIGRAVHSSDAVNLQIVREFTDEMNKRVQAIDEILKNLQSQFNTLNELLNKNFPDSKIIIDINKQ